MPLALARLEQLAARGDAAALALWAEARADADPLARRDDPLCCLQRASLQVAAGDIDAARAAIEAVPDGLPRGLAGCREELLAAVAIAAREQAARTDEMPASPTGRLGELMLDGGESVTPAASLATWLTRVKGWREVLGV